MTNCGNSNKGSFIWEKSFRSLFEDGESDTFIDQCKSKYHDFLDECTIERVGDC